MCCVLVRFVCGLVGCGVLCCVVLLLLVLVLFGLLFSLASRCWLLWAGFAGCFSARFVLSLPPFGVRCGVCCVRCCSGVRVCFGGCCVPRLFWFLSPRGFGLSPWFTPLRALRGPAARGVRVAHANLRQRGQRSLTRRPRGWAGWFLISYT